MEISEDLKTQLQSFTVIEREDQFVVKGPKQTKPPSPSSKCVFVHVCVCVCFVFLLWSYVCIPRASFIQRPRGKHNLLPVLMVPPAVPVWIGFRGHQSQAIRSKWSLCNTRQTAKSFRTKPRPLSCVCVCVCLCILQRHPRLPYFTQPQPL